MGSKYLFNTSFSDFENADCILFLGTDMKRELPLVNARLRSSFLRDKAAFACVGASADFNNFPVASLGIGLDTFEDFISGRHSFCKV